jgi:hypothetical protein
LNVRTLFAACAALLVVAAASVPAAAAPERARMEPIRHFPNQKKTPGFYKGRVVRYLDFGPIRLAAGNKVAPIWVFTNGASGQRNIIDVAPGDRGYSPLWQVTMVTWQDGSDSRVLRSAAAVRRAAAEGELTLRRTSTVVNCPVVGFRQRETLGHFRGQLIAYLDLGPVKLRAGNKVAPIWVFTNGAAEQHNVIDVVPGQRAYTPLWRVTMVTWRSGASARVLSSAAAIRSAVAAGDLTLRQTATVVNCPVI